MTPKSIVDQRLPDGDGFDVLRAAREAGIPSWLRVWIARLGPA
jgi:hypothetical protein